MTRAGVLSAALDAVGNWSGDEEGSDEEDDDVSDSDFIAVPRGGSGSTISGITQSFTKGARRSGAESEENDLECHSSPTRRARHAYERI